MGWRSVNNGTFLEEMTCWQSPLAVLLPQPKHFPLIGLVFFLWNLWSSIHVYSSLSHHPELERNACGLSIQFLDQVVEWHWTSSSNSGVEAALVPTYYNVSANCRHEHAPVVDGKDGIPDPGSVYVVHQRIWSASGALVSSWSKASRMCSGGRKGRAIWLDVWTVIQHSSRCTQSKRYNTFN